MEKSASALGVNVIEVDDSMYNPFLCYSISAAVVAWPFLLGGVICLAISRLLCGFGLCSFGRTAAHGEHGVALGFQV